MTVVCPVVFNVSCVDCSFKLIQGHRTEQRSRIRGGSTTTVNNDLCEQEPACSSTGVTQPLLPHKDLNTTYDEVDGKVVTHTVVVVVSVKGETL